MPRGSIRRDVPRAKVIILSQYDESEMRARAFEVGAQGYISKSDAARQLLIAIESLISNHNSGRWFPETFRRRKAYFYLRMGARA